MSVNRAAATAVVCGDLILLGKRIKIYNGSPVPYGGYWSLFGGSVEKGESPIRCAVRELLEETGIKAEIHSLRYITSFNDDDLEFIVYVHEVDALLIPTLDFEHTEYGWFKLDFLRNFIEKIDPKIVECVEIYRKKIEDEKAYFPQSSK